MPKRMLTILVATALALGGLAIGAAVVQAHACTTTTTPAPEPDKKPKKGEEPPPPTTTEECGPTDVYENWRDNYLPLFDLADRDDEQQKRDAQRWRDENGCENQFCIWAEPSASRDDPGATFHGGTAGEHALGEAAHSDEGHPDNEFGNHDSHGGAIYLDVCAGTDDGTSYEDNAGACSGPEDTQAGITVVDHLTCPAGCADEYHVVRPLDTPYTQEQLSDSQRDLGEAAADPKGHLCGYEGHTACP